MCTANLEEYVFKEWKQETRTNSGGKIGSQSSAEQLEQIQPECVNECVSDLLSVCVFTKTDELRHVPSSQ